MLFSRKPLTFFKLAIAVLLLTTCWVYAHPEHLSAAIPHNNSEQSVTIKNLDLENYFELFAELVLNSPTELQEEVIGKMSEIFAATESGQTGEIDKTAEKTAQFYEKLGQQYAVIKLVYKDGKIQLAEKQEPVIVARSVSRWVLVELQNYTEGDVTFSLGGDFSALRNLSAAAKSMQTVAAKLLVNTQTSKALLKLTSSQKPIEVPVKCVEPAVVRGRIIDSDRNETWPGRVYVVASDKSYCYGKIFIDKKTLSEKRLLQFPPNKHKLSYKLPFFLQRWNI